MDVGADNDCGINPTKIYNNLSDGVYRTPKNKI